MASPICEVLSLNVVDRLRDFDKRILVHGTGEVKPNRGSVCIIKMTNVDNVDLSKEKLGRYDFGDGCKVTIGEESGLLPDVFDKVLMTMKKGEHAYVRTQVDVVNNGCVSTGSDKAFKFNIFLESFECSTDIEDLSVSERAKRAENLISKGVELFKAKEFRRAMWKYETALVYFGLAAESKKPPDDLLLQCKPLIVQCHLNLAESLVQLKQNYERVIDHCDAVLELEDKSAKVMFLRGLAHYKIYKLKEARADFAFVRATEPQNNEAQKRINDIDTILKRYPEASW